MTGSLVSPATRQRVRDLATPIATALGRLGLTPNALTLIGFVGTVAAGIAAGIQQWLVAGILVLAFGIFDLFDGTLARATGQATKLGAFLDSTFDRAGEALVYIGVAIGTLGAGDQVAAVLCGTAMAAAFLVSYTRAKAESLGFASGSGLMNVGLAPREVRTVLVAVGLFLAALGPTSFDGSITPSVNVFGEFTGLDLLELVLASITILATITVIQRILHVRAQAKEG